jgi:hypothetical protein
MRSYHFFQGAPRSKWWFLWPFWTDSLEPFFIACALGGTFAWFWKGDPNYVAIFIVASGSLR